MNSFHNNNNDIFMNKVFNDNDCITVDYLYYNMFDLMSMKCDG